ncbi:beta-ketoacyl synthase chain length factor [Lysobacter sp. GX 14042]|uniref:beta-ketoacyl synthase chain length factor n=1 Tax=Lysobacter sp. GX 14042 TaxID=2907155 RepID=UPI001F3A7596|nr:beta-ketoacyl synthase chain length factor [Lysobacter sp. GX 14042]MCE7032140.1 beta-ketoacyl synthase chain length factor [Lysobacter sp. GX 14042]
MSSLACTIEGIGFWSRGLPSWEAALAFARAGVLPEQAPAKPSPQLLAANERRRAPETVAVALEVALAACRDAGREPGSLPSVFASSQGDLVIADYMSATLAASPAAISPTRFHNSVHNAAAGYWTIGTGAMHPATALSAGPGTFAQGLLEALAQLACGAPAVLLVGYDGAAIGPLGGVVRSEGLLGCALVLGREARSGAPRLRARLAGHGANHGAADADVDAAGPLARHAVGNASSPMLPLFDALARGTTGATLDAGAGRRLEITFDEQAGRQGGAHES